MRVEALAVCQPLEATDKPVCAPDTDYKAAFERLREPSPHALAAFETLAAGHPSDVLVKVHRTRLQAGEHGNL